MWILVDEIEDMEEYKSGCCWVYMARSSSSRLIVLLRENEGIFGGLLKQLCVFE